MTTASGSPETGSGSGHRGGDAPCPELTVVMPVLNGRGLLPHSVAALEASTLDQDRWELLVVDDGSTDDSAGWIRGRGHRVVGVDDGPRGPAFARNLGAQDARGRILAFVDVDVCVHEDALGRMLSVLDGQEEVGAVFGSYDDAPPDPGFPSQYRNLYHRWVHLRGAGDAETFWAGCGAVRAGVFADVGGFDDRRFPRPQIEDIELGYRIREAGWRILLDPAIQGTHLKRWTVAGMVRTDLLDRGVPWMRLLLADPRPDALNVNRGERLRVALVGLSVVCLAAGAVSARMGWLVAAAALLGVNVASNAGLYRWLAHRRGGWFALRAVPFNLLYYGIAGLSVILAWVGHLRSGASAGPPRKRGEGQTPVRLSEGDPS